MNQERITIALAGNANVGKSVIFNHLTGMHQHIGNWPGKTVERMEGDRNQVETAKPGDAIGIKVTDRAREHDIVYKVPKGE